MSQNKDKYKVLNWKSYNTALCKRGGLHLWLSADLYRIWRDIDPGKKTVGDKIYPDVIITTCLTIQAVYSLPLRQTTGFIESIFVLMGLSLSVPDYSTLSRRKGHLGIKVSHSCKNKVIDIVVDSTGLKVYGEGEWKVRKHGWNKHRTWRKLHIGIDAISQEIVSVVLTGNEATDADVTGELLNQCTNEIKSFRGDGAYDRHKVRKRLYKQEIKQIIPPQRNAVMTKKEFLQQRNQAIERIEEIGRKKWKKEIDYHLRSLVETAMFRYKSSIGNKLSARKIDNQINEARIGCHILNVFNRNGMPISEKIK